MTGSDLQAAQSESQPLAGEALPKPALDQRGWIATGSLIGAVFASTCCIVPLVLVTLGISGAWIGNLTALAPYKPYFIAATVILLGAGFWQVYRKPKPACEEGSYCASPVSGRITKGALWLATLLVLFAITIDYWALLFY